MKIETKRLFLREMISEDFNACMLCLLIPTSCSITPYTFDETRVKTGSTKHRALPRVWLRPVGGLPEIYGRGDWRLWSDHAEHRRYDSAGDWLSYRKGSPVPRLLQKKQRRLCVIGHLHIQLSVWCIPHEKGKHPILRYRPCKWYDAAE